MYLCRMSLVKKIGESISLLEATEGLIFFFYVSLVVRRKVKR